MFLSCADVARRALSTLLVRLVASRFWQKADIPHFHLIDTQANWSCVVLCCVARSCCCYFIIIFSFNFNTSFVCTIAQRARAVCMALKLINDTTDRYNDAIFCQLAIACLHAAHSHPYCTSTSMRISLNREFRVAELQMFVRLRIEIDADSLIVGHGYLACTARYWCEDRLHVACPTHRICWRIYFMHTCPSLSPVPNTIKHTHTHTDSDTHLLQSNSYLANWKRFNFQLKMKTVKSKL